MQTTETLRQDKIMAMRAQETVGGDLAQECLHR